MPGDTRGGSLAVELFASHSRLAGLELTSALLLLLGLTGLVPAALPLLGGLTVGVPAALPLLGGLTVGVLRTGLVLYRAN
jgi:hypothetical protein